MSRTLRGRFITLEGGEGAGKTTQTEMLVQALAARHLTVVRTREPGGAPGAELLRGILLNGQIDWSPAAETLLHFAARAEHVATTIEPALVRGDWVVCDRFYDSTMAYQGYGQGADRVFISELIRRLGIVPDLTIVLDVPEDVATARLRQRGTALDRYESLGPAFHARVRAGFREIAETERGRCLMLDASAEAAAVHKVVVSEAMKRLG